MQFLAYFTRVLTLVIFSFSVPLYAAGERSASQVQEEVAANDKLLNILQIKDASNIQKVEVLSASVSGNKVFKLVTKAKLPPYVLKWVEEGKAQAKYEMDMQTIAAAEGLAANIYYRDISQSMFVMEFLYKAKFSAGQRGRGLLQEFLNDIHMIKTSDKMQSRDMYQQLADNIAKLKSMHGAVHPEFLSKFEKVLALREKVPLRSESFTHNALNLDNLFFYDNKFRAISWQHSGVGDPYYDIASAIVWYLPSLANHAEFLSSYYGYPANEEQVKRLFAIENLVKAVEASKILIRLAHIGEDQVMPEMTGTLLSDYLILLHSRAAKLQGKSDIARLAAMIMNSIRL